MTTRRDLLRSAVALPLTAMPWPALSAALEKLPVRPIPGTGDSLPIVGLGNSQAFRSGDRDTSRELLTLFLQHGGRYIDCGGDARFHVAEVLQAIDGGRDAFLGAYFRGADAAAAGAEAERLLALTGKSSIDLMHGYPEDALPNWSVFRELQDAGLAKYLGVARHRAEAYPQMMALMKTGTVDVLQVNYSLVETEAEDEILPLAQELGIAVTINRPFINGRWFDLVRGHELPAWAADFDCESWAQFSLKFILSHPAVTCVLTETANPRHALENIRAGIGPLPDAATRERMRQHVRAML